MRRLSLLLVLCLALNANAQHPVKLTLEDGSVIRASLVATSLPVELYGTTINIPLSDVVRVRFGVHPTQAEQASLSAATRSLGSVIHKEREIASRSLRDLGRLSIPSLRKASTGADMEVKKRAADLLQEISEADPREAHEFDLITLKRFSIEGAIKAETLAFKSATLGEFTVSLGKIESMVVMGNTNETIVVDAANEWVPTGIMFSGGEVVTFKATGVVDLWPTTPGQYTATPERPYNTAGRGGQFLAGALVGRIGANGPTFLIGAATTITMREVGELHLGIVGNPWNAKSAGQYSVTVKTGR